MSTRALLWMFAIALLCFGRPAAAQATPPCLASASWFSNPSFPTEVANGLNANNCDFHQFAWQAFIDVVQPANGNPGLRTFETWMPDYGVFVPAGTQVTPWGEQPAAPCVVPANADAKLAKRLFLRPRIPKGSGFDPDSHDQATGDPLYDQNKQVVYYSIWINQTEYNFITQCDFNNTTCVTSAPATAAITPGAVELKGSWRVFKDTPPTDMYTVQGVVGATCQPVTLGLVGFHLVMNTPLHPEFIWATFEHKSNAPDCTNPQKAPAGGWSFNNPQCQGSACTPNQPKVNPTQVCRVAPQGGGSSTNVVNIKSLNDSVHLTLQKLLTTGLAKYAPMQVWLNYEMTGNLWTVNGALPPSSTNEAGSLLDANTTLETFIQGPNSQGVNQNCFTCHTQQQFVTSKGVAKGFPNGAPANFSHLWGFAQQTGGCNNGQGPLPAMCPLNSSQAKSKKLLEKAKKQK